MTYRLMVVGVLSGLCSLITANHAQAASTQKRQMVGRVYQVADLIIPRESPISKESKTTEQQLIQLIQSIVQPRSWSTAGGEGDVAYFPLTMSLVVSQTPEVHAEIQDLLMGLRRNLDTEVTVELRFVTASLETMQRLGMFNDGQQKAPGMIVVDDTQLQMLLETVQQDRNANVMQAPRLTMFNGQRSMLDLTEQQLYLVGVDHETKDGKPTPKLITKKVKTGYEIQVLPTLGVKPDEVILHLSIQAGRLEPVAPGCCSAEPRYNTVKLEKILKLPQGATAVLTGWTHQSEVRQEVSMPVLSKAPYLNRLFTNSTFGREMVHTLVLVTPRIVDTREVEDANSVEEEQTEEIEKHEQSSATDNKLYINKPTFDMTYELENVGPSKVQSIEVWVTRDGRTWEPYPQPVLPIGSLPVTVKGEGKYGFTLVPRSGVGLQGPTPKSGDEPQAWVIVDMTKPHLELYKPQFKQDGQIQLKWFASDNVQLADNPVSLYWAEHPQGRWNLIQDRLPAEGELNFDQKKLPHSCYLRAEVVDAAGNIAQATTSEPIHLDSRVPVIRHLKIKPR